ncbi:Metal transporter CNNM4 [Trichoplax sp. H2]|nr:Metal transporter CNNM4 [Trichoplax sp. H2]|eukprot:RDD38603.1 Metal transporter CNNM4 [Trichoplax sp. H2]
MAPLAFNRGYKFLRLIQYKFIIYYFITIFTLQLECVKSNKLLAKEDSFHYTTNGLTEISVNDTIVDVTHPLKEDRIRRSHNQLLNSTTILSILPLTATAKFKDNGALSFPAYTKIHCRIVGRQITPTTQVGFSVTHGESGHSCDVVGSIAPSDVIVDDLTKNISGNFSFSTDKIGITFYLCTRQSRNDTWVHQGREPWLTIEAFGIPLPLFVKILFLIALLLLSGLFSGLNLGLMALDPTELQVVITAGNETEQKYAKVIEPIRRHGNYLLCTILLGNVLVNNTLTILLDDITSGIVAVIGATISIVILGEIIPQSICSRYGLAIGARTIWLTKLFMVVTAPLSYPLSMILDWILGAEIGRIYTREKLLKFLEITKKHNDIENDEMQMISGVLNFKKKTVVDVMTKYEDVFMLEIDSILDFDTIDRIYQSGHSRIPVYEGDCCSVVSILHVKDLAFVDPDDRSPLRAIVECHNRPVNWVYDDTSLDRMLDYFKKGISHMVLIKVVRQVDDRDPVYDILGVVTLEDVIEELIQSEIVDETDVYIDNRSRKPVPNRKNIIDLSMYRDADSVSLSPQQTLAVFRYLSSVVDPFFEEFISETILKRLLKKEVVFDLHVAGATVSKKTLYESGIPADYFIMIVEGKVSVIVGAENLGFESGSFSYFGAPCLIKKMPDSTNKISSINLCDQELKNPTNCSNSSTFIPDYSVYAITDLLYIKVTATQYIAARQATEYERTRSSFRSNDKSNLHNMKESSKNLPEDCLAISISASNLRKSNESLV